MKLRTAAASLLPALLTFNNVQAAPADYVAASTLSRRAVNLEPETRTYLQQVAQSLQIQGGAIAVVGPNGQEEIITLGKRDVRGTPVTSDTYFAIASNSKLFTATAIVMMIEDQVKLRNGQPLTLNSRMADIIPGWNMTDPNGTENATLLDLMSMVSGLPQHIINMRPEDSAATFVDSVQYLKTNVQLRTQFQYSNANYVILGRIAELLLNQTLESYIQSKIFRPLGMNGLFSAQAAGNTGRRTQGFALQGGNAARCAELISSGGNPLDPSCFGSPKAFNFWTDGTGVEFGGGGYIILTPNDMLKWTRELTNPSVFPASITQWLQNSTNIAPPAAGNASALIQPGRYHLGLVDQIYRNHTIHLHDGALPGSESYLVRSQADGVGVFAIGNTDLVSSYFSEIAWKVIFDDLLGLPFIDWAKEITDSLLGGGSSGNDAAPSAPNAGAGASGPVSTGRPAPLINGTFTEPAYDSFTLVPLNISDQQAVARSGLPFEFFVNDIASAAGLNLAGPVYYARYRQTVTTHIVMTHFDGPLFNYTLLLARPEITNSSTSTSGNSTRLIGKTFGVGPAVYAEGGLGFFGNIWLQSSALPVVSPVETNVAQAAPVFFRQTTA